MNQYIITGSVGHVSRPIIAGLVKAKKDVSVITSNKDKVKEIEALGAKAIVGSLSDAAFVNNAFKGAEVVYTMIPPIWQTNNWKESQLEIARIYVEALKSNGINYVVNLSSIGAHLGEGCGPVDAMHDFEQMLNGIKYLNVKHLRPSSFYYNLLNQIGLIKQAGMMGANYGGGDQKIGLVHWNDIAKVALDALINLDFKGNSVQTIVSDYKSGKEIATILGKSVDKDLSWVEFTDEQQKQGMLQAGVPAGHAEGFTAMGISLRNGKMQEEIAGKSPNGLVKLEEFAKEFAAAYNV